MKKNASMFMSATMKCGSFCIRLNVCLGINNNVVIWASVAWKSISLQLIGWLLFCCPVSLVPQLRCVNYLKYPCHVYNVRKVLSPIGRFKNYLEMKAARMKWMHFGCR